MPNARCAGCGVEIAGIPARYIAPEEDAWHFECLPHDGRELAEPPAPAAAKVGPRPRTERVKASKARNRARGTRRYSAGDGDTA